MRWSNRGPAIRGRVRLPAAVIAAAASFTGACAQPARGQAPPASESRFAVVLDAAHGGSDPGGRIGNLPEKTITLALSVKLRSLLSARGIRVVTTRESDVTLDPERRAEIANHAEAQACLRLHASVEGSGVHLFVSSLAPAKPALFEPWNAAQAAWVLRSVALEGMVNSALQQAGMTVTLGRTALPVIDSMTCPAVVVEVAPDNESGHATAEAAAASLNDPAYQARVAQALAAALVEWRSQGVNMGGGQP
jgi:N-acetylmuramoyl-L-alanine amidase